MKNEKKKKNPLSHARGKQRRPESVWFRRSGAGFQLFVQYYAGQPIGTVSSLSLSSSSNEEEQTEENITANDLVTESRSSNNDNHNKEITKNADKKRSINSGSGGGNGGGSGHGQSRASKRRKKKKSKDVPTSTAIPNEKNNNHDNNNDNNINESNFSNQDLTTTSSGSNITPTTITTTTTTTTDTPLLLVELKKYIQKLEFKNHKDDNTYSDTITKRISNHHLRPFLEAMSKPLPLSFRLRETKTNLKEDTSALSEKEQQSQQSQQKELIQMLSSQPQFTSLVFPVAFGDNKIYQGRPGISKEALNTTHKHSSSSSLSSLSHSLSLLKQFLLEHSQNGNLARQEIGSMLPVLALTKGGYLGPSSRVIDMCASPGSKTLQALEIIVSANDNDDDNDDSNNNNNHDASLSSQRKMKKKKLGRIIANDVLESRLKALEQAIERSGISKLDIQSRITYSCQDATRLELPSTTTTTTTTTKDRKKEWDAVICDVPCSGDGTCRKDKHILPMWQPNHGNQLHETQLKILVRALQLVKVNGVVCYSTCSLNPIEDEAVVAAALKLINNNNTNQSNNNNSNNNKQYNDKKGGKGDDRKVVRKQQQQQSQPPIVELIDFPDFPGFIRRPGIQSWRVADFQEEEQENEKNGKENDKYNDNDNDNEDDNDNDDEMVRLCWYDTFQDAVQGGMESPLESMWPPPKTDNDHDDDDDNEGDSKTKKTQSMRLDRCTRLWPQDHDTGGFFVALIRKNSAF